MPLLQWKNKNADKRKETEMNNRLVETAKNEKNAKKHCNN